MKRLFTSLLILQFLLVLNGCDWIEKRRKPEASTNNGTHNTHTIPSAPVTTYSGTASYGEWKSYNFQFKKRFKGDLRIKNLTFKYVPEADANHTFYMSGVELRNFPSDATIEDSEREPAMNITRAGKHIDIVFEKAKFSGTDKGDKIEGEFELKIPINEVNTGNTKDAYITAPITLYKQ